MEKNENIGLRLRLKNENLRLRFKKGLKRN